MVNKSLTPAASKEIAAAEPDSEFALFDGVSTGFENVRTSDLLIPRITILQALSPQVTRGKPEYDPDAKAGDFYDVGLAENFGETLTVIPVHFFKQWLEWAPRNTGKGLINVHDTDAVLDKTEKDDRGRDVLKDGNYIAETAQFYVVNGNANWRKSFIAMTSTQLKKARSWMTRAMAEELKRPDGSVFMAPLFYRSYILTTVLESNNDGSWYGWKIERGAPLPELENWKKLRDDIMEFRKSIDKGEVQSDKTSLEPDGGSGGARTKGEADNGQAM